MAARTYHDEKSGDQEIEGELGLPQAGPSVTDARPVPPRGAASAPNGCLEPQMDEGGARDPANFKLHGTCHSTDGTPFAMMLLDPTWYCRPNFCT